MNCEQTLNNLPHFVVEASPEPTDRVSAGTSRRAVLEHLRRCPECQMAYEALWHTASVLESTDEPVPPPELAGNIQARVRELHHRKQLAFLRIRWRGVSIGSHWISLRGLLTRLP